MHKIFIALAAAAMSAIAVAPETAAASTETDVMAAVFQWLGGFNRGDMKTAVTACAAQTSIIDNIPPHEWHGAGACSKWAGDFSAYVRKNGITDWEVTLGKPRHVTVTDDRAYVVVPATYMGKQHGKPVTEPGSIWTLALQNEKAGWRITGWAWTSL
jgi:predicted lipoprotein with Yx(FWY)xxD motif